MLVKVLAAAEYFDAVVEEEPGQPEDPPPPADPPEVPPAAPRHAGAGGDVWPRFYIGILCPTIF